MSMYVNGKWMSDYDLFLQEEENTYKKYKPIISAVKDNREVVKKIQQIRKRDLPVRPEFIGGHGGNFVCPVCGETLHSALPYGKAVYCPKCGQKLFVY